MTLKELQDFENERADCTCRECTDAKKVVKELWAAWRVLAAVIKSADGIVPTGTPEGNFREGELKSLAELARAALPEDYTELEKGKNENRTS
jgi:hypothetical protein